MIRIDDLIEIIKNFHNKGIDTIKKKTFIEYLEALREGDKEIKEE